MHTYQMKLSKVATTNFMDNTHYIETLNNKQRFAFNVAGHAAAIYLNNKSRNLPPIFFQIVLNDSDCLPEDMQTQPIDTLADVARLEGGRLLEFLPDSVDAMAINPTNPNVTEARLITEYKHVIEADIINLLTGPLAEAKYVANTDAEVINQHLVNLAALKNYGGSSNLVLIKDYLKSLSLTKQEQTKKLEALFIVAFSFINNQSNWTAITRLARYLIDCQKNIVGYQEIARQLERQSMAAQ